jgi:hypothetical protein
MSPRFVLVWFNPFFGVNKYKQNDFSTLAETYQRVNLLEKNAKACGYPLKFKILTTKIKE